MLRWLVYHLLSIVNYSRFIQAWKSTPHCGDRCEDTDKTNEKMADQGSGGDQLVGLDPNQL